MSNTPETLVDVHRITRPLSTKELIALPNSDKHTFTVDLVVDFDIIVSYNFEDLLDLFDDEVAATGPIGGICFRLVGVEDGNAIVRITADFPDEDYDDIVERGYF